MQTTTYTDLRKRLAEHMERVNQDHEPLMITRAGAQPVVMMSLEDFASYEETRYLLASPANAKALEEAIEQDRRGETVPITMDELKAMLKSAEEAPSHDA